MSNFLKRVLVIGDPQASTALLNYLVGERYDVSFCSALDGLDDAVERWRPHVVVLTPEKDAGRHADLERIRRRYPSLPVVLLTPAGGQDLLLDLEAFAPAIPVKPSRGLQHVASAVRVAMTLV